MDQSLGSLLAQPVKNLPAKQEIGEMWVRSLGREGPLEKEPTLGILPGETHGQKSLVGYSPWGHQSRTGLSSVRKAERQDI